MDLIKLIDARIDQKLALVHRDPNKSAVYDGSASRYRNPANNLDEQTHALIDHKGLPGVPLLNVLRQTFEYEDTIIINHNFGRRPIVQVLGGAGPLLYGSGLYGDGTYGGSLLRRVIDPDSIVHDSVNQVTITLTSEDTGEVVLIG